MMLIVVREFVMFITLDFVAALCFPLQLDRVIRLNAALVSTVLAFLSLKKKYFEAAAV